MRIGKYFLCLLFIVFSFCLMASSNVTLFKKYKNKYFVESGSYVGYGIQYAIEARFKYIYSIELDPGYYHFCKEKFIKYSDDQVFISPFENYFSTVKIFQGDSGKILGRVIRDINEPITFWLDGHYSGEGTAKGDTMSPILNELEWIKKHPIKNHTILIDDVRLFGTKEFDYVTKSQIIIKILEINPKYKVSYDTGKYLNDVLVAEIK